jgi:ketosteroid isomerase-like protein
VRWGKLPGGLVVRSDMDVIKAVYEAFAERDVEGVIAYLDDDVEFSAVTGDHAGRTEPYRGHDGIRQYFRDLAEVWDELRMVPSEYRQDGNTVLVTGRVTARSPARIVAGSTGWIWRMRDGLVVYVRVYPSAADAMAAFEGRGV